MTSLLESGTGLWLRNPLATLRNGLQYLKLAGNDVASGDQARAMMERQLGQVVRPVDDLMDINRITLNKLALKRQRVELAPVPADLS